MINMTWYSSVDACFNPDLWPVTSYSHQPQEAGGRQEDAGEQAEGVLHHPRPRPSERNGELGQK